jgi:recombination protein RecA
MTRAFDASRFRKGITKSITGISTGFNDPRTWVSTGNYCLNYLISGDFYRGIPLSKVTCFAGESGSGKSYICSGNLIKNAQDQGVFIVLMDTENALDETWLQDLGVDTSEEKLMRIGVSLVNDVARVISDFMKDYKSEYDDLAPEERPKVLFVVDSLGMLQTPASTAQFEGGDMKGDMGIKAKQLKALVSNSVNLIAPYDIGIVATNHTYASQDMFNPDEKISGGEGFIYASSIVIGMKKKKLKEDENGNKVTDVRGIKSVCKVVKSRYAKPFETVEVFIPYATGMDPYSGLFDLFEKTGVLVKEGNRYKYTSKKTGEVIKEFRKVWATDTSLFDLVMSEFTEDDFENRVQVSEEVENVE